MEFNESQKTAIDHRDGPMMVLAGPGSGKTTVITHRIKRLLEQGVSPSGILVITFTKAAATEMRERFYALMEKEGRTEENGRVSFGTFHSVFYHILRIAYRFPPGNVIGEAERREFFQNFLKNHTLEIDDEGEFISSILNEISHVKESRMDLSCYYSQNCPEEWFKKLYQGYEEFLRSSGKIDFDDMLVMCYELFTQRKDILSAWQKKYRYILVDEFQDINRLQYEIVRMLALPENNLFIVGDDDQSIYRFRGARPEIMLGFEKDYPDTKKILLPYNYRSTWEIVDASLKLIGNNKVRFPKQLLPSHGCGKPVEMLIYENPIREMDALAKRIREYQSAGYCWEDMAVLYRTGTVSGLIAEKLLEYNVPFQMRDLLPNIYNHWIAEDFFTYLEIAAGDMSRKNFFRIMNRPNRYLSRDAFNTTQVSFESLNYYYTGKEWMQDRLCDFETDLRILSRLRPKPAIHFIRQTIGYDQYLEDYAKFRRIRPEEFMEIADQLEENAEGFEDLASWKRHIAEYEESLKRQNSSENKEKHGVVLSTMHSAKGLEFPIVFVLDVNEGSIPHHKASSPADIEEERRLFYVALTRAKERLHLLAVRERHHKKQDISRFAGECRGEAIS